MTESVRYVVQDFGSFFNEWHDRYDEKGYKTAAEAKKKMPTPYERQSRVIRRMITETVLTTVENTPPTPKYKLGDTVRADWQRNKEDGQHFIISEIVKDSFWNDGHRWNYRCEGVGCKDPDSESKWREYELHPYTIGGVKPKERMSVVALEHATGKYDLTKGQIYTVRSIWADGKVEIEDDEEDIIYLMPDQYRLTI